MRFVIKQINHTRGKTLVRDVPWFRLGARVCNFIDEINGKVYPTDDIKVNLRFFRGLEFNLNKMERVNRESKSILFSIPFHVDGEQGNIVVGLG